MKNRPHTKVELERLADIGNAKLIEEGRHDVRWVVIGEIIALKEVELR